jgi:hypothetical protein
MCRAALHGLDAPERLVSFHGGDHTCNTAPWKATGGPLAIVA